MLKLNGLSLFDCLFVYLSSKSDFIWFFILQVYTFFVTEMKRGAEIRTSFRFTSG